MTARSRITLRQGDVALLPVAALPEGATRRAPDAATGRVILAYGEVTGHHHSLPATGCALHEAEGVTYLTVEELVGPAVDLVHQEHAPLAVTPGVYEVVRQREYAGPARQAWVGD